MSQTYKNRILFWFKATSFLRSQHPKSPCLGGRGALGFRSILSTCPVLSRDSSAFSACQGSREEGDKGGGSFPGDECPTRHTNVRAALRRRGVFDSGRRLEAGVHFSRPPGMGDFINENIAKVTHLKAKNMKTLDGCR